ncbi:homocysteine S-methyltransferase family protein [Candidatus Omnitrophota bacterium]
MDILERIKEKVLIYDGAMGTMLQERGVLKPGAAPEELNLIAEDAILGIHKQYVEAGADIIETNTFGGHRLKLKQFGLEGKFKEINAKAVAIAKKAIAGKGFVAAGIGPLEQMVAPLGPIMFDEAIHYFKEWVEVVANEGCDIILFETFSDIRELKAAIIAARAVTKDIPIQAQLTYDGGKQTVSGTPPEVAAVSLSAMDVQIIGTNCSTGPEDLIQVVEGYYNFTDKFISVLPNAGMPELIDGKMVFKATPESMAKVASSFIAKGANIIGGCCGTTPEHIKALKKAVGKKAPLNRNNNVPFTLSSRTKLFCYDEKKRPFVIGERINPTGKKMLSQELAEGKTSLIRRYAMEQTRKGADLLDINVGISDCNEQELMEKAVAAVQAVSDLPLVIDSSNIKALEAGLREASGKVLINSVNGEDKHIAEILPLITKYGAAILGLTTDDNGIPSDMAGRMSIISKINEEATGKYNISRNNIVIDPLALTIASESKQAKETLHTIEKIKEKYGFLTSLGLSNISFGLPDRARVNAEFLSLAVAYGLDFAIANPNDEILMSVVQSQARAEKGEATIDTFIKESLDMSIKVTQPKKKIEEKKKEFTKDELPNELYEAILYGHKEEILNLVEKGLGFGYSAHEINTTFLVPALEEVGRRFEKREFFLPHVIMAAETMQLAFQRLKKELKEDKGKSNGTIVMATVEGDFHDIGKNIVIAILENYGYEIIDLGRNIKADEIIVIAQEKKADIIGLSALMTTTMIKMEEVVTKIKEKGLDVKTIVGGAVLTQTYAEKIGADAYAKDAVEAAALVKTLLRK